MYNTTTLILSDFITLKGVFDWLRWPRDVVTTASRLAHDDLNCAPDVNELWLRREQVLPRAEDHCEALS